MNHPQIRTPFVEWPTTWESLKLCSMEQWKELVGMTRLDDYDERMARDNHSTIDGAHAGTA